MARIATPSSPLGGLAAVLLAACGGGAGGAGGLVDPGPPGGDPPPATFSCTGPIPEHATLCPGADAGLTQDATRTAAASCACTSPCVPVPCAHACDAGFVLSAGACVAAPPPPPPATFTDHGDGTVTDDATGLTWLRDAGCTEPLGGVERPGPVAWAQASEWIIGLSDGACGLTDGSAAGDWQLPALADLTTLAAHLAPGHPFQHLPAGPYWTSSSSCIESAAAVDVADGRILDLPVATPSNVWPVRWRQLR